MEFLLAITACCLGFLVAWFVRSRQLSAWQAAAADSERQLTADKAEALRQLSIASETLRLRTEEAQSLRDSLEAQTRLAADRAVEAAALRTANANLLEQLEHRKQETENLQKRLTTEFENMAGRVLWQRSEVFAASNHQRLGELLNPRKV